MRVALFGGSFDPPHHGHLAIATAAANALRLDSVLFAPAGRQPLKLDGTVTSFEDRLAMAELACLEDSRFTASEIDAPRADGLPNYRECALKLARNPQMLAALRARLAAHRDSFPLFKTQRFTLHIEAAYTAMWERHQRGDPPAAISVPAMPPA